MQKGRRQVTEGNKKAPPMLIGHDGTADFRTEMRYELDLNLTREPYQNVPRDGKRKLTGE